MNDEPDTVDFMRLDPRERLVVSGDFLRDGNAPSRFTVNLDETVPSSHGSFGPPPDGALMLKELDGRLKGTRS